jgi:hypothetical protein
MKSSKLIASIVLTILFSTFSTNTIFAAASGTTGSSLVVVQNDQKTFVPREETKVTKEYITALALDGLYRVYKAGLDFTDVTGKFRDLGKIDETIMCAFGKNSLLYVTADEWDSYKTCITSKGLIDGNNKTGMVFDKSDLKRFTEDNSKVNPPFFVSYRGFPLGGRNREFDGGGYIYPGPLALIYWGIKNIGVNLLNDGSSLSSNNCEKLYTITRQAIPGDGFYYNHPSFTFIANEYKEVDQQNCAQSLPKYVSCEVSRVEFKGTSCEKLSIGKACLQFINSPTERFQQLALEVIELINSRKSTGDLQYVDKMSVKLNEMQSVLDQHSKKKVLTDSSKQSNLINLHLTTEGATKLGQKVHEHMRDAYVASTSSITDDQAVNLATQFVEILKAKGFDKLMTQEEMGMDLDAILAVFDEMKKFHAGEINPTQQKLGVTGTNALVMQSLNDYRLLDNNVENKAQDTLRQAFHIGRVLQANEGTKEFDVTAREEERQKDVRTLLGDIKAVPAITAVSNSDNAGEEKKEL